MKKTKSTSTTKATPRPRAKQQRAVDTTRSILDAAMKEFAEHGYTGVSTRTVARIADVPHGSIAYHFGGKQGLWRAVIADMVSSYKKRFDARLEELRDKDSVTRLQAVLEEMFDVSTARLDFHRIMAHLSRSRSPQLRWVVEEFIRDIYDRRAELIREAQRQGRYVAGEPYHLQYLFLGAVMMTFLLGPEFREITGRRLDSKEFLDEHKRLCLSLFFRSAGS